MMMNERKEVKPLGFFLVGMLAFLLLGLEFGVLFISRIIDGRTLAQIGQWPIHWYGAIFHWSLTIIVWLCGALLIWRWMRKKGIKDDLISFRINKKVIFHTLIAITFVILYTWIESLLFHTTTLQVISEYRGFQNMYGDKALIIILFQVLYYVIEMILVLIMIVMFQRMGELVFKNKYIPYGSILLMLTWGMIHFLSHPAGALSVTIWALVPGLFYIFGNKRFYPVYVLLLLGFIL